MSVTDEVHLAQAVADEVRRVTRDYEARLRQRDAELASLRQRLDIITSIDQAKMRPPKWLAPPKRPRNQAIACFVLSDLHYSEVVTPEEIEGLNAYNTTIANMRLKRYGEKAIRLSRDYVSGLTYDGAVLFLAGDIVSGDIHMELEATNEGTTFETVISLLDPLAALIRQLANHFGQLHVAAVVGNHGRRTHKPRAKKRAQDNVEWMLYKVLARETGGESITWQVADGADARVPVYGHGFLLTHGDQFKGGTGISGALAPLMLGSHRKIRRALSSNKPYDILVMGHFHQYLQLPGIIVSGTVKGMDEYGYLLNLPYEEPQQAFWIATPERAVTLSAPLHVMDRSMEGW